MVIQSFHGYLEGIVQGVGMRYFVFKTANTLELTGYVKNLTDGRVELYVEGKEGDIKQLLKTIKNSGVGRVDKIEGKWKGLEHPKRNDFKIEF